MRKLNILLALVASLFVTQAKANFTGKDASAATITFYNPGVCTSVVCTPVFQLTDGTNVVTLTTAGADTVSNTLTGVPVYARNLVFNGTTWDRWQGAVTVAGVATAANQTTGNTSLGTIVTSTSASAAVEGTTSDTAYNGSGNSTLSAALRGIYTILSTINTNIQAAIAAGTNYIGQVGAWVAPTSYVSGTTSAMTGTTSTQLLAAVTSKKLYVLSISCVNSHATVGTFVTVQDGSGGTALATLAAASVFGGDEKTSVGPLFSTTSGNGLFVADVTTGANVICNASGFAQ